MICGPSLPGGGVLVLRSLSFDQLRLHPRPRRGAAVKQPASWASMPRQSVQRLVIRHAVENLGRQFLELGGQTLGFAPGRVGLPILAPDHVPATGTEGYEEGEVEEQMLGGGHAGMIAPWRRSRHINRRPVGLIRASDGWIRRGKRKKFVCFASPQGQCFGRSHAIRGTNQMMGQRASTNMANPPFFLAFCRSTPKLGCRRLKVMRDQ